MDASAAATAATIPPPPALADDAAVDAAIARLGEISRALSGIEDQKSKHVAQAAADAEAKAKPLQTERDLLEAGVRAFCGANRARLTDGGRTKTAKFRTGEVSWRKAKDRLMVDTGLLPKILEALKKRKLLRMIRTKEELDKTAIAKEFPLVKGIRGLSIETGGEELDIKPIGLELAETPAAA